MTPVKLFLCTIVRVIFTILAHLTHSSLTIDQFLNLSSFGINNIFPVTSCVLLLCNLYLLRGRCHRCDTCHWELYTRWSGLSEWSGTFSWSSSCSATPKLGRTSPTSSSSTRASSTSVLRSVCSSKAGWISLTGWTATALSISSSVASSWLEFRFGRPWPLQPTASSWSPWNDTSPLVSDGHVLGFN